MSMKFLKAMNKECEFLKDSFKIFEKKGFFSSISGELQIFDINNHLSGIHEMIDDDTYDPKIDSVGNEDEILQLDREISDKSLKHLRLLNTLKLPLTKPIKDNLMTEVKTLRSEVEDFFETEYDLTPSNVYINLVENVIVDSSNRDDLPTVAYISIGFDGNVQFDIDELTQKIHELDYGDEAIIDVGTTKSHMPTYILTYSLITLFVFGLVGSVYYLIRFKYSYGLASLSTIIPAGVVSVALFVCTRIATSPLVVMGIASGLFIAALSQVPLFSRMKKLTRESKVKVTTYEQRKNIVVQSVQETLHICMSIAVLGVVSLLAIAFFVPIDLITVFIGAIIALLIATVLLCFLFTPVYLAIEKYAYNVKLANLSKSQERRERKGKKRFKTNGSYRRRD